MQTIAELSIAVTKRDATEHFDLDSELQRNYDPYNYVRLFESPMLVVRLIKNKYNNRNCKYDKTINALQATADWYKTLGQQWFQDLDVSKYVDIVHCALRNEEERAVAYMLPCTCPKLLRVCLEELVLLQGIHIISASEELFRRVTEIHKQVSIHSMFVHVCCDLQV